MLLQEEDLVMMTGTLWGMDLRRAPVQRISIDAPTAWLNAGWRDFRRAPAVSLSYGGLLVLCNYLMVLGLHRMDLGSLIPAAIAGFFLVAPILAVGLCDVSRRLEQGQPVSLGHAFSAYRRNARSLAAVGLILMLSVAAWMQMALLIFMLFFHSGPPPLDHFIYGILMGPNVVPFLLTGTVIGGALAAVVFAISAVSLPMLLEHEVSATTAMAASVAAVIENWPVMLSWAGTIVVLVGIGFATAFIGLAVTLPLVAYATWHCYRALFPASRH